MGLEGQASRPIRLDEHVVGMCGERIDAARGLGDLARCGVKRSDRRDAVTREDGIEPLHAVQERHVRRGKHMRRGREHHARPLGGERASAAGEQRRLAPASHHGDDASVTCEQVGDAPSLSLIHIFVYAIVLILVMIGTNNDSLKNLVARVIPKRKTSEEEVSAEA